MLIRDQIVVNFKDGKSADRSSSYGWDKALLRPFCSRRHHWTRAAFDISLRAPKNQDFGGTVDISLLRSRIFLESGVTENSAFYVSARKSFIHLLVKEQTPEEAEKDNDNKGIRIIEAPQDEDYQFKYLWDINKNNKIIVAANGATDYVEAELTPEADFIASNPDFAGDAKIAQKYNGQSLTYEYQQGKIKNFKRYETKSFIYYLILFYCIDV